MQPFDRVFTYLFPLSLLEPTQWLQIWRENERRDFISTTKIFFPIVAVLYFAHYWLFDLPMQLEPGSSWLLYRVSMVAIALAAYAYYALFPNLLPSYRLVAIAACTVFCVTQSWVAVFYPKAPWLYCFVFVIVSTLILRSSVLKSCLVAIVLIALQWRGLMASGVAIPEALSASGVTLIAITVMRGNYLADIRYFLLTQENLDAQRRNIELNIEFTDRIKFFIPRQIATRMERFLRERDASVINAIYEVLKPKKRQIACLFSDIRGFTEGSKDLDSFVGGSVLPNVKACTDAIESCGGIPRKIGDLVFAYFDDSRVDVNLLRAVVAGMEIALLSAAQNAISSHAEVKRYILISVGEAIVGNIGGFDSSVEITALGSPVNFLSRLDEATKDPALSQRISSSDLVMCDRSLEILKSIGVHPEVSTIDLPSLGVSIRNFQDEKTIHCLRPTEYNRSLMRTFYNQFAVDDSPWNEDGNKVA
jgi:class 3 adenylate cyclase